jgi:uncharacterized phage protein (TIGR02218 family)
VKTFSAGLAASYASGSTSLCACLRVHRTDGVVALFTAADQNVTVGGEVYLAATGLSVTNLVVQAGMAVDNMEMPVLPDETSYPQVDILAGQWDNAEFWLFECDYTDATIAAGSAVGVASRNDINLLKRGNCGESETLRSTRKFELRGLKQRLQQSVGEVTSKTCRYRLGDERCLVDLEASPSVWVFTHVVTAVASGHVFTCAGATEASDFFGDGIALSLDGENATYSRKIKSFAAGVFTLALEMPFPIFPGDTFRFTAGCRKRWDEDCKQKFDNLLNFGGEKDIPGPDAITKDPDGA